MPSKKKKTSALSRRLSKSLKKHHARAQQIQKKQPWLSYQEARHADAETFIETIRRSERKTVQLWTQYREKPSRFKRIKRGLEREALGVQIWDRKAQRYYLEGDYQDRRGLSRIEAMYTYWGLVERTAKMFDLPKNEARALLSRMREEMQRTAIMFGKRRQYRMRDAAAVLEYSDRYPKVREEFGI